MGSPTFSYTPLLPTGDDKTEYRLITTEGIEVVEGPRGLPFLTVAPEVFRFLAEYRMVIYGAILLGLILFRPQGLLGGLSLGLTRRVA